MSLHVYLLCHNEQVLLPHAVEHYRRRVPSATFTILDNESDDRSREIATQLGCAVQTFSSGGKIDDVMLQHVKNTVWQERAEGWVIVADMDEWLCVTTEDLAREERAGTTILRVQGWNVVAESSSITLDDLDLHTLRFGARYERESKSVCFRRPQITAINYSLGAHRASPEGAVRYSRNTHRMKHMNWLGAAYVAHKYASRYQRGKEQQARGLGIHYTDQTERVIGEFNEWRDRSRTFFERPFWTPPTVPRSLLPFVRRRAARVARRVVGLITRSRSMSS